MGTIDTPDFEGLDSELCFGTEHRTLCCVGLLMTLYVKRGASKDVRQKLVRAFRHVTDITGNNFVWGGDPATGHPMQLSGTNILALDTWVPQLDGGSPIEIACHGGQRKDDASPYLLKALFQEEVEDELSFLSLGLPLSWVAHRPHGAYIELVIEICRHLQPIHGYAGLGIIPHVNESRHSEAIETICALAGRFRGLELDFPESHSIYLAEENKIKGVNWLTVLSDEMLAELPPSAHQALSQNAIVQHRYPGGLAIQAGPRPLFGDVNRAEPMPHYELVASALSSIRIDYPTSIAWAGGFDEERTRRWFARFDQ